MDDSELMDDIPTFVYFAIWLGRQNVRQNYLRAIRGWHKI